MNVAGDKGVRTFIERKDDTLSGLENVQHAAFFDLYEDGTLDIIIQKRGTDGSPMLTFLYNNFYNDAFFLKSLGLLILTQFSMVSVLLGVLTTIHLLNHMESQVLVQR